MKTKELLNALENHQKDEVLVDLYEDASLLDYQRTRYMNAIKMYETLYGEDDVDMYSVAGRSEVGGNHTDHQHGCVLAASINLDAIAVASKQENVIKIVSDDFNIKAISIDDLEKKDDELGTSEALIRGVVSKLKEEGYVIGGFKAYVTSDVLVGAGLSSSAAFEGLIGTIISGLYNDMSIDMVTIAKIGQYAENVYFGKPCGLMDQCACAVGGLISIDFKDPSAPIVTPVNVDFSKFHHSLCIVDTKGSHANLTEHYAAIPYEMKAVAKYLGKEVLRDVDTKQFDAAIPEIREACGDRSVIRAMHFFEENDRVGKQVAALTEGNFDLFKQLIQASGNSSFKFLQNVYAFAQEQNVSVALALSEHILQGHGVCRVHGGGFAGTIQAFVEDDYVATYQTEIEKTFGEGACHVLKVRKLGGCKVF